MQVRAEQSHARLDLAGNLANEESFVGRTIQKRQNSTSGLAKEQIPTDVRDVLIPRTIVLK